MPAPSYIGKFIVPLVIDAGHICGHVGRKKYQDYKVLTTFFIISKFTQREKAILISSIIGIGIIDAV